MILCLNSNLVNRIQQQHEYHVDERIQSKQQYHLANTHALDCMLLRRLAQDMYVIRMEMIDHQQYENERH